MARLAPIYIWSEKSSEAFQLVFRSSRKALSIPTDNDSCQGQNELDGIDFESENESRLVFLPCFFGFSVIFCKPEKVQLRVL